MVYIRYNNDENFPLSERFIIYTRFFFFGNHHNLLNRNIYIYIYIYLLLQLLVAPLVLVMHKGIIHCCPI